MQRSVESGGSLHPYRRSVGIRVAAWIGIGVFAAVLAIVVAIAILLNNPQFHRYLLRTAEAKASASLGVKVEFQDFALHLNELRVDLYGITVDGANPYPNPPLLEVDHVEAGVRIVSILHRAWYLKNLRIERPVVRMTVDAHGVSNIPSLQRRGNINSHTSLFDLGIRHALLDRGEIYYNDRLTSLTADLHDLQIRAAFNHSLQRYSGTLVYTNGRVAYGAFRPVAHSFEARFEATPETLDITQSAITIGNSHIALAAMLRNYNHPDIRGHYDILLNGEQLGRLLKIQYLPMGMIRTSGSLQYQQTSNSTALESMKIDGELASHHLDITGSAVRVAVSDVAAHYSVANGEASLRDLHARALGGELIALGSMNIGRHAHSNLVAEVRGISLENLTRAIRHSVSSHGIVLQGVLDAKASASWGVGLDDVVAHTDAIIRGEAQGRRAKYKQVSIVGSEEALNRSAARGGIPIESAIHATYRAPEHEFQLDHSYLRTSQTVLTMNGIVSAHSKLKLLLQANDLREIEMIADVFRSSSLNGSPSSLGLAGTAAFQGIVKGSTTAPHLTGQLAAQNLQYNGTDWRALRTDVDLSPSNLSLQHADIRSVSGGRVTFGASTGLTNWSFTKSSPIKVQLTALQVNVADIETLTRHNLSITGTLNGGVRLHGNEMNPTGNGEMTLTDAKIYEQPVSLARVSFTGGNNEMHGNVRVVLPAGDILGKVSLRPLEKTYAAEFEARGVELARLQAISSRHIDVAGVAAASVKGSGSFSNPQCDGTLSIPRLAIHGQAVTGINLHMNIANHVADATLHSSAVNTLIDSKAKVQLTGDFLVEASLNTQKIPLEQLFGIYAPQISKLSGQTELHATLQGPLKRKQLLEAHLTVPILKLSYGNAVQLAAATPIQADYRNGVFTLQHSSIQGTDTNLQFQGSIPITGNTPPSIVLLGTVNLKLVQLFDPNVRSSGEIRFNINSQGLSDVGGQIAIRDANFASADLPVGLQHANGELSVSRNRLNIRSFEGSVGGGAVTAQGGVAYGKGIQFDMGLDAKGVRMLYPEGLRESIDGDLRLTGTPENAVLGGSIDLSDLSATSAFDLTTFITSLSGGVAAPPSRGFTQNIRLNVAVRSTNNVSLTSRMLTVGGTANLQVRGTVADPVVLGRVNLNRGDVILHGDRFVLNGGTIQFVNPTETQPVVNLNLNTTIQQYSINLRFNGPVNQLRTEYNSDPALPPADIINLLAFGKTSEASAATATPANQAAESLVASQVSSQVTSRISKIAGISQLSINPVFAGSNSGGPPGANITIQQRVTGNLFITFSTNVASTQGQTIQGQYQVSPRLAVSATRDPNGGFALDTLIKKSW
jgi:translocation and assembly module TamB